MSIIDEIKSEGILPGQQVFTYLQNFVAHSMPSKTVTNFYFYYHVLSLFLTLVEIMKTVKNSDNHFLLEKCVCGESLKKIMDF